MFLRRLLTTSNMKELRLEISVQQKIENNNYHVRECLYWPITVFTLLNILFCNDFMILLTETTADVWKATESILKQPSSFTFSNGNEFSLSIVLEVIGMTLDEDNTIRGIRIVFHEPLPESGLILGCEENQRGCSFSISRFHWMACLKTETTSFSRSLRLKELIRRDCQCHLQKMMSKLLSLLLITQIFRCIPSLLSLNWAVGAKDELWLYFLCSLHFSYNRK